MDRHTGDVNDELKTLKEDLNKLRADLKNFSRSAASTATAEGGSRLNEAKNRIWNSARDIEERAHDQLGDTYDTIREHGQHALEIGRKKVEQRPIATLLGAFAAGIFLGGLFLHGRR